MAHLFSDRARASYYFWGMSVCVKPTVAILSEATPLVHSRQLLERRNLNTVMQSWMQDDDVIAEEGAEEESAPAKKLKGDLTCELCGRSSKDCYLP
eukprot:6480307-Amphidinium_carterae.2